MRYDTVQFGLRFEESCSLFLMVSHSTRETCSGQTYKSTQ